MTEEPPTDELPTEPLNTRLPKSLHDAVKIQAVKEHSTLQKLSHAAYTLYLLVKENEDFAGTKELVKKREHEKELAKKSTGYRLMLSGRNALAKEGMDVSVFDAAFEKTEEYLQQ